MFCCFSGYCTIYCDVCVCKSKFSVCVCVCKPNVLPKTRHFNLSQKLTISPKNHSPLPSLQVAERKADLYLHTTDIKKWDICAGDAVLRTLGGHMTTMTGEDIDYGLGGDPKNMDGILATATESEHAQYLERLKF